MEWPAKLPGQHVARASPQATQDGSAQLAAGSKLNNAPKTVEKAEVRVIAKFCSGSWYFGHILRHVFVISSSPLQSAVVLDSEANQLCRSRSISQDFVDMKAVDGSFQNRSEHQTLSIFGALIQVLALELWYRADVFNVDGIVRTSLWQDGSAAEVQERRDCPVSLREA